MAECSKIVPYKDCSGQSLLTGLDLSGLRDVIVWCVSIEQQEEVSQRERVQVHTDSDRQYNCTWVQLPLHTQGVRNEHARLFPLILIKSYV